ncbi:hypothetical protein [Vulcanisaeta thermophila]|uniref:hypothetical protein n=1 Tax=Vulcanisaeta thermophila TaxID=867917 RepID=UPI00117D6AC6|nr:hypothetical protein [Vulcanisaeta thermophila]
MATLVAVVMVTALVMAVGGTMHPKPLNPTQPFTLLSGVPKPRVCFINYPNNQLISTAMSQLGELGLVYTVVQIPNQALTMNCSLLVIPSQWLGEYGGQYRDELINALERGLVLESMGPNAGNALLGIVGNYLEEHASIVIGEPLKGPVKVVKPMLPSNVEPCP